MDKHIEIIGIDHGWSNMKTVSLIVTTYNRCKGDFDRTRIFRQHCGKKWGIL